MRGVLASRVLAVIRRTGSAGWRRDRPGAGVACAAMLAQAGASAALLVAYGLPYTMRARTLSARGRDVPTWRLACFGAGLVLLAAAIAPPVDAAADERLSVHMVEHVIIGDLAPLLIVLGLTGPVLAPVLRVPAVARLRGLTHPIAAFALWAASLYLWHLRVAYEGAVRHDLLHVLEHACFFAAGANLWLALLGPLPKPAWFGNGARLVYVLAVSLIGGALAYAFAWAGNVLYPYYAATAAADHRSAIADQGAAGGVMLVEQSVVIVALLAWLLWRALRDAEQRQRLAEHAAAAGVSLDARRIARAVAAEQGEALARRIDAGERFAG
jgi:putative membrane protein